MKLEYTYQDNLNNLLFSCRILVLDEGTVGEFDSPNNLISNHKSIFYGLCKEAGLVD